MAYEGKVTAVFLCEKDNPEAMKIINLIGEEEDRPGRNVAERLILEAGKLRVKKRNKRPAPLKQVEICSDGKS